MKEYTNIKADDFCCVGARHNLPDPIMYTNCRLTGDSANWGMTLWGPVEPLL
jgi:hypothetical protein